MDSLIIKKTHTHTKTSLHTNLSKGTEHIRVIKDNTQLKYVMIKIRLKKCYDHFRDFLEKYD